MSNKILERIKEQEQINSFKIILPVSGKEIKIRPMKTKEAKYIAQIDINSVIKPDNVKMFNNYNEYKKDFDEKMEFFYNTLSDVIYEDINIKDLKFLDFVYITFFLKQISNAMSISNFSVKCSECKVDFKTNLKLDIDNIEIINKENLNSFEIDSDSIDILNFGIKLKLENPSIDVYSKLLYINSKKSNVDESLDLINDILFDSLISITYVSGKDTLVMNKDDKENPLNIEDFKKIIDELYDDISKKLLKKYFTGMSALKYINRYTCPNCGKVNEGELRNEVF